MTARVIAVTNQKGGVGKTTTTVNLAQALSLNGLSALVVDLDPQGNATQGLGISLDLIKLSVSDVIRERDIAIEEVIYRGQNLDLIPATPLLARVEREMVGMTNSEMRLKQQLQKLRGQYSVILLDTPPTLGPLLNSALNAADSLIVPVDPGCYAMMGIKELLSEIGDIRSGINPNLEVLGYLFTLSDQTRVSSETWDGLVSGFGEQVFETKIRRNVKLKEAPVFGRTIFHHSPTSSGAEDYLSLAQEVIHRAKIDAVNSVAACGGVQ